MAQLKTEQGHSLSERFATLRHRIGDAVKWWAEHQSWPATDEIRIDRHHRTCL